MVLNTSLFSFIKDRCQVFSSIHRLSKEFDLLKPIESIEQRLLEMSIQRIDSDFKKATTIKETTAANENSREVIKLIDFIVCKHTDVSEKLISSNSNLIIEELNDSITIFILISRCYQSVGSDASF